MRRAAANRHAEFKPIDRKSYDALIGDFVRIELELADTFCSLATQTRSPERARQHRLNARRATETAVKFLTTVHIDSEQCDKLLQKAASLNARLQTCEERMNAAYSEAGDDTRGA